MKQISFDFDQSAIDNAVGKIQVVASFVGGLGGFLPDDPMALGLLRRHVAELRDGLAILNRLAVTLQQLQEKRAELDKYR